MASKDQGVTEVAPGKFLLRYDVYANGKRKQKTETFYGTKTKARLHRSKLVLDAKEGKIVEPQRMSVEELTEKWLKHYSKNRPLKTNRSVHGVIYFS